MRLAAAVAYGAVGALVGVALAATVEVRVGPFETTFSARPSLAGETLVRLAPLGTVRLDTHDAPVAVEARIDELRRDEAESIAEDPSRLAAIEDQLAADARSGLWALLVRSALASIVGGAALAFAGSLRLRAALVGAGAGAVLVGFGGGLALATWNPRALAEPRYSGLLSVAPRAVGDAEAVLDRFGQYRAQLAGLVDNVVTLYRAGRGLPTFDPDEGRTIRLLHVSDVHLNPQAFDLMEVLVDQFDVDAVVDTGDSTDFGTTAENQALAAIGGLPVPYVWVRGNHDSPATADAVAALPNAVVLDGDARAVAGMRFFGVGDPRYTPDKARPSGAATERREADLLAPHVAAQVAQAQPPAVDVLVVHDARLAAGAGDRVPLVLAGHNHVARRGRIGAATLLVQGSTGGAGLRGLQGEFPEPLTASVLYFDPSTKRLVAYDQISVRGLGETGARIERHLVRSSAGDAPSTSTVTTTPTTTAGTISTSTAPTSSAPPP